ncbi:MAG: thioredoxin family protein [Candidatus Saccharimonadales bacterium]
MLEKSKPSINKITLALAVAALVLIILGVSMYVKGMRGTGQNVEQKVDQPKPNNSDNAQVRGKYDYYGTLSSVDGSSASGEAGYSFLNSNFVMLAKFSNLAEPQSGYFYEGWLVDSTNNKFISTGKANSVTGTRLNSFSSSTDYSSFNKYVLTIEPDDGNPAPATHILEGGLSKQSSSDAKSSDTNSKKNGYISLADYQSQKTTYDSGKVVLFFNASWCPTCKVLDESLARQIESFPKDLTVVNVDYDKETELKSKYGVRIQHTLVQIDSSGNQIAKWSGGGDLQSITDQLK